MRYREIRTQDSAVIGPVASKGNLMPTDSASRNSRNIPVRAGKIKRVSAMRGKDGIFDGACHVMTLLHG